MSTNDVSGCTPLPWLLDGACIYALDETGTLNRFFIGVQGGFLDRRADERTPEAELLANAKFIFTAVNNHHALVTALKASMVEIENLRNALSNTSIEILATDTRPQARALIERLEKQP